MIKKQLTAEQQNYNKSQEATLSITGLKQKGFRVIVGRVKGGGMFDYSIGDEKTAKQLGEGMKAVYKTLLSKQDKNMKIYIHLEPCELKKCNIPYCKNLCESDETYCLKCEDLMYEAQMEYAEQKEMRCEI